MSIELCEVATIFDLDFFLNSSNLRVCLLLTPFEHLVETSEECANASTSLARNDSTNLGTLYLRLDNDLYLLSKHVSWDESSARAWPIGKV